MPSLNCTWTDATTIRQSLLKGEGLYDPLAAFQLDSPSCGEIRAFFQEQEEAIRGSSVFTVFFSGHGHLHDGKFYLCPADYNPSFPSACGISISELIRYARDLEFKTLNIIIDACQSGQSGADLRESIERPAREDNSSLCVSIIASCLPDQFSITGNPLSAFTELLNDFIVGARDALVARSILTLSDISQLIPDIPQGSGRQQTVVHYSLNVLGPAHFCINPLYDERQRQPHNFLLSPHSSLGAAAFRSKEALENVYSSIGGASGMRGSLPRSGLYVILRAQIC